MAIVQQKHLIFGNIRITAAEQKAHAHELEHDDEYTHRTIVGIDALHYDANVGGEPEWVELSKGVDIGELLEKVSDLQGQLKAQKMYNGRLKKRAESMGILLEEDKEK